KIKIKIKIKIKTVGLRRGGMFNRLSHCAPSAFEADFSDYSTPEVDMPLGEAVVEGLTRIVIEIVFEGVAYVTGYIILFPFTFGRVRERFSSTTISFVGLAAWVVFIGLILWQPWQPDEPV
ncbi:hypothetical protein VSU19_00735, partial [Verrucomicrobiales bacterium BCK34]|nr:hypothetical protein [Verrucomicrobiales bacterium BCK34]